jgi:hypothetical protein
MYFKNIVLKYSLKNFELIFSNLMKKMASYHLVEIERNHHLKVMKCFPNDMTKNKEKKQIFVIIPGLKRSIIIFGSIKVRKI